MKHLKKASIRLLSFILCFVLSGNLVLISARAEDNHEESYFAENDEQNQAEISGFDFKASERTEVAYFAEDICTIEATIQLPRDCNDRGGVIFGNYNDFGDNCFNFEIYSNGRPRLYFQNNGQTSQCIFGTDIRSEKSVDLAITLQGNVAKLYVDGQLKETKKVSAYQSGINNNYVFGGDLRLHNNQYFKGKISSLRLFSTVRGDEDISEDFNGVNPSTPGLLYSCTYLRTETITEASCGQEGKKAVMAEIIKDGEKSEEILKFVAVPSLQHDYEKTTFPTSEEQIEYDQYVCKNCGNTIYEGNYNGYSGLTFDKNNQCGTYPINSAVRTIEATVELSADVVGRGGVIFGNYSGHDNCISFEIYTNGRPRVFFVENGVTTEHIFKTDIRDKGKITLAVTIDNNDVKLYVDGVLKETAHKKLNVPSTGIDAMVGGDRRVGNDQYFKGTIYAVRTYSDVRTDAEVLKDVYVFDEEDADLLHLCAFYKREVISQPTCDKTGRIENTATIIKNGAKTEELVKVETIPSLQHNYEKTTFPASEGQIAYSKFKCSVCGDEYYDGNYNTFEGLTFKAGETVNVSAFEEKIYTFEASIELPTYISDRGGIIFGNYMNEEDCFNIEIYSNGRPRIYAQNGGKAVQCIFNTDIRSNKIVNIAITIEPNTVKLYVDGVLKETKNISINVPVSTRSFVLGGDMRFGNVNFFKGTIYAVNIFSDIRNDKEIEHDCVMLDSQDSNMLAAYRFITSDNYKDYSLNGYDIGTAHVKSFAELKAAVNAGMNKICIISDIEVNETLYVTRTINIYSRGVHTIRRAADFGGDIFVVGENKNGVSGILLNTQAVLSIGKEYADSDDKLIIDGNAANMTAEVNGTVFFICGCGVVNLYDDVTVTNCIKTSNAKTLQKKYDFSYSNAVGGAVAIVSSGSINIYGGTYTNNSVNDEITDEYVSSRGGVIYNAGTVNIYGGRFANNRAGRGGVIYNYKKVKVYGGIFESNMSQKYAAVFYQANSQYCELLIGLDAGDGVEREVLIKDNESLASGGVIFSQIHCAVVIYENAKFINNKAKGNGGVINTSGSLVILGNALFEGNTATSKGGVVYAYYNKLDYTTRHIVIDGATFRDNDCPSGGAICFAADNIDYPNGPYAFIENTTFDSNNAKTRGGAIYVTLKSNVTLTDCTFTDNTSKSGGAVYVGDQSKLYVNGGSFDSNSATGNGGALYIYSSSAAEINDSTAVSNSATENGGVLYVSGDGTVATINGMTANTNSADKGGVLYVTTNGTATINGMTANTNSASGGGVLYITANGVATINDMQATSNSVTGNGGVIYAYTSSVTDINGLTATSNSATGYGGVLYSSGESTVTINGMVARTNNAGNGGAFYITTTGTRVIVNSLTVDGNTATTGPVVYGNTTKANLDIVLSGFRDLQSTKTYTSASKWKTDYVANKLTVTAVDAPAVDDDPTDPTDPISSVTHVAQTIFNLAQNANDGVIDAVYANFPVLDKSSNFMSRGTKTFEQINGKDVTVDSFVYLPDVPANNPSVGEGILIYQAMLYKQAHPDEEVSISISSFRFSVEAAVNICRDSRYFGYMRNLYGMEYDSYGFVRISYLLIAAASMGINVTVVGQIDGYPIDKKDPTFIEYFNMKLDDLCDPVYASGKKIGDYLDYNYVYWTSYEDNGATDMMHTKTCAVSKYLDKDGVAHQNAIWVSCMNLDGISIDGTNGNNGAQTAVLITNHDRMYQTTVNYINLITQYCGQEEVTLFREIASAASKKQIDMILAGEEDQIPFGEQIVYLGTENDDVFELYFSPFGGDALSWNETYNPYSKYLRKLSLSDGYIYFSWNNPKYNEESPLFRNITSLISNIFYSNNNLENKLYIQLPGISSGYFSNLKAGKNIGFISINQNVLKEVHAKDMQLSYSINGERVYVSFLDSLNNHDGSMYYQSNSVIIIKEKDCSENSVFFTIADKATPGMVEHSYGELQTKEATCNQKGYTYRICTECGKMLVVDSIDLGDHHSNSWIVDVEATETSKGLKHKSCDDCGQLIAAEEIPMIGSTETPNALDYNQFTGLRFNEKGMLEIERPFDFGIHTFEVLLNLPKEGTSRGGVIIGNYDVYNDSLNFELYNYGCPRLFYVKNGQQYECLFSTDVRSDGKVHIAITTDGTYAKLYVNGELKETKSFRCNIQALNTTLCLGGDLRVGNAQYFKGTIYALNLFNDTRTADEVYRDYLMVDPNADGLLASYYFVTDNDMADKSSNGNDVKSFWISERNEDFLDDIAYSIAVVGDPQTLTLSYPDKLHYINDWILANKDKYNIQHVLEVGDLTYRDTDTEWLAIQNELYRLNGIIDYSIVRGNHDGTTNMNKYFNNDIYAQQYDGRYDSTINNTYKLKELGGEKYLILNLDYGANDDVLAWAGGIISENFDRKVIVMTHCFLFRDGSTLDKNEVYPPSETGGVNNGDEIWEKFASKYETIQMIVCGHDPYERVVVSKMTRESGNVVTSLLIDFQYTDKYYRRSGVVTVLSFHKDGKTVTVTNYATVCGSYYRECNQFDFILD